MSEVKTKPTDDDVDAFLQRVEPEKKRKDCVELKRLFDRAAKEKPAVWNNNMIGYGSYHYKSERSRQEGDWPLTGFSPRKQNITIYIMPGVSKYQDMLAELGTHTASTGSCIYIKKLEDVDLNVLERIVAASVADMKELYRAGGK